MPQWVQTSLLIIGTIIVLLPFIGLALQAIVSFINHLIVATSADSPGGKTLTIEEIAQLQADIGKFGKALLTIFAVFGIKIQIPVVQ